MNSMNGAADVLEGQSRESTPSGPVQQTSGPRSLICGSFQDLIEGFQPSASDSEMCSAFREGAIPGDPNVAPFGYDLFS